MNDESNNTKTLGCGLKTQKHSAAASKHKNTRLRPQNTKTLGFASKHKNTRLCLKTQKHSASPQNT
ncbi:hypothetical protein KJ878_06040, partial [Patescibacteria group bacterium]|nr:hypothetical protein [Patescibacteria group bacterium]